MPDTSAVPEISRLNAEKRPAVRNAVLFVVALCLLLLAIQISDSWRARQERLAPKGDAREYPRALTPKEMELQRSKPTVSESTIPGDPNKNIVLSPSQLGYSGG